MDRNVVTRRDAESVRAQLAAAHRAETGTVRRGALGPGGGTGIDTDIRPDTWFQRLTKFIPAEALSLYLALAGLVTAGDLVNSGGEKRPGLILLSVILGLCVAFNTLFLRYLWRVRRWLQIVVSDVALLTYAFATGGMLIQQLSFYEPRIGTAVLVVTTAFLAFFRPPSERTASELQEPVIVGSVKTDEN